MSLPCDEHVLKMHNKIIFSFDTFVIITAQPLSSDFSLCFCSFGLLTFKAYRLRDVPTV